MKVKIYFEPRDAWVGVFWDRRPNLTVWICVIPFVPIRLTFEGRR